MQWDCESTLIITSHLWELDLGLWKPSGSMQVSQHHTEDHHHTLTSEEHGDWRTQEVDFKVSCSLCLRNLQGYTARIQYTAVGGNESQPVLEMWEEKLRCWSKTGPVFTVAGKKDIQGDVTVIKIYFQFFFIPPGNVELILSSMTLFLLCCSCFFALLYFFFFCWIKDVALTIHKKKFYIDISLISFFLPNIHIWHMTNPDNILCVVCIVCHVKYVCVVCTVCRVYCLACVCRV